MRGLATRGLGVVMAVVLVAALVAAPAARAEVEADGFVTETVKVPTRANELLHGQLAFPTRGGVKLPGPFPVVLEYTPYCNPNAQSLWTSHGYVYAGVHVPGACGSDGRFTVFEPAVGRAGYDVVEWLAAQPWATGKVGMVGASAPGIAQLHTARERPPHLTTIVPSIASLDFYEDLAYPGGILSSADPPVIAGIIIGLMMVPGIGYRFQDGDSARRMAETDEWVPDDFFVQALSRPLKDEFWTVRDVDPASIDVPVFALGNWDDFAPRTATRLFTDTSHPSNRLAIGGVGHNGTPLPDYDGDAETVQWMDHWLKGADNGMAEKIASAPIEYYGLGGGGWRTATAWPPSNEVVTLQMGPGAAVLGADGALVDGPVTTGSLQYAHVPAASTSVTHIGFGPFHGDQRTTAVALTYASEPLADAREVTGAATVKLRAATNAADTDWIVRLVDIAPDGTFESTDKRYGDWRFATNGQLRASHRAGHDHLEPVPAGQPVEYTITLRPVSYLFKPGHRIGLQITSADPTRSVPLPYPALNTVFHGSSLTLPLGPG